MSEGPISARRRLDTHVDGLEMNCFIVPAGMDLFNPEKEGDYRLEIIPFRAGAGNPYADPGQWAFERTYFTHKNVGANQDSYVCPAKTLGMPCPVCEEANRLRRDPDADIELVKEMKPKERQLWYVYDHAEPEKGVQFFEVSNFLFGKILDTQAKSADPGENWEFFADPVVGLTVKATFEKGTYQGRPFIKCTTINFKPRQPGSEQVIRQLMASIQQPLDALVKVTPYDKLRAILYQEPLDPAAAGATPPPATTQAAPPTTQARPPYTAPAAQAPAAAPPAQAAPAGMPWVKGASVQHPVHGACTVFKVNPDGTATLMTADDDPIKNVPPVVVDPNWAAPAAAGGYTPPPPPELKHGDNVHFQNLGMCRVHKVSGDMVVVLDGEDDIHKLPLADVQAARIAAMTIGMHQNKAPDVAAAPPAAAPPAAAAAQAAATDDEAPWDEKW